MVVWTKPELIILLNYFGAQYLLFYKLHIQWDLQNVNKLTASSIIIIIIGIQYYQTVLHTSFRLSCLAFLFVCLFSSLIHNSIRVCAIHLDVCNLHQNHHHHTYCYFYPLLQVRHHIIHGQKCNLSAIFKWHG